MTATSFLEQKPRSPTGFGLVLLLHGAAIAGIVMIKGPEFVTRDIPPLITDLIPNEEPPPPLDPPRPVEREQIPLPTPPAPHVPDRIVETIPTPGPRFAEALPTERYDSRPATSELGTGGGTVIPPIERPRPTPVRTEALFDSRGGEQQPPYPALELRSEREGQVRVQVRIGANGRVLAVSRISATSDAFWRATERHALSRWRFRPATEDGRPVESSKTLTVHFRLDGS